MIASPPSSQKREKRKTNEKPWETAFFWLDIYIAEKKYNKIESAKIICLEIFDSQNSTKI
jgi:hypothetical protein